MARRAFRLTNLPVAALGVASAGLGAAVLTFGSGDVVVKRGFEHALAAMGERPSVLADTAVDSRQQLRLTHVVHDSSMFTKPVAVGDSIAITSGGHQRVLHVVNVAKLDNSVLPISSERPVPLLLVTCRDEAKPDGRPVRFLIEADKEPPTLSSPKAARTL